MGTLAEISILNDALTISKLKSQLVLDMADLEAVTDELANKNTVYINDILSNLEFISFTDYIIEDFSGTLNYSNTSGSGTFLTNLIIKGSDVKIGTVNTPHVNVMIMAEDGSLNQSGSIHIIGTATGKNILVRAVNTDSHALQIVDNDLSDEDDDYSLEGSLFDIVSDVAINIGPNGKLIATQTVNLEALSEQTKPLIPTLVIAEEMKYNGVTVLEYRIEYPELESGKYRKNIKTINTFYKDQALLLQNNFRTKLYQMAVDQYLHDIENGFPVRAFDALQTFTATYNKSCIISLYLDLYQYTGGAHGMTTRTSQTWNLRTSKMIKLKELYKCSNDYKAYMKKKIIAQIAENPDIYFENYEELVEQTFNVNSFYCTPEALVIYFQQYDIAPYSSGIREFPLPYNKCIIDPVRKCRR